jgi:hypothetical protein
MTNVNHETKQNATREAEALADAVLRAAGSGLHYYSMAKTREAILSASQRGLILAKADLLEALELIVRIAELREDNKHRPEGLFELLRDAAGTARAAIGEAKGLAA